MNLWNEIYNKSKQFEEPFLLSGTKPYLEMNQIVELFGIIQKDQNPGKNNYFRSYLKGNESYEVSSKISQGCPIETDLDDWLKSIFASNRYGLIMNGPLSWSNSLVRSVVSFAKPLKQILEGQRLAIDLTLFFGNYGYTPLGVHLDSPDHRTLLLNLGPNEKKMILWKPEWITEKLGPITNYYYPENILEYGECYTIKPNDIFLLPSKFYHIGYSQEYSVTAALIIKKQTPVELLMSEMQQNIQTNKAFAFNNLFGPHNIYKETTFDEFKSYFDKYPIDPSLLMKRAEKRAQSNFDLLRYPHKIHPNIPISDLTKFKTFGELKYHKSKNRIDLFCRGRTIKLPDNKLSNSIIKQLSQPDFSFGSLSNTTNANKDVLKKICETLYSYKYLEEVE